MITYPRVKNDPDLLKSIKGARLIQLRKHEMDRSVPRQEVVIMDKTTPVLTIRFDGAIEEIAPVVFKQPMKEILATGLWADMPLKAVFYQRSLQERIRFSRMVS